MSFAGRSLLNIQDISDSEIHHLFEVSKCFKKKHEKDQAWVKPNRSLSARKCMALVFFEPSTRTSLSFQMAAQRAAVDSIFFNSSDATSSIKGESPQDSLENIVAMGPDVLVVRFSDSQGIDLDSLPKKIPVINGGRGATDHPTQALLDAFTIMEYRGNWENEKILFVGDVVHSRVASSNLDLLSRLGAQVGVCGPSEWLPSGGKWKNVKLFDDLKEGLGWASVCMGLRVQKERHFSERKDAKKLMEAFKISQDALQELSDRAIVMHPGPFERDIDFDPQVLKDPRCVVRQQVTNGVYIRAALLAMVLGLQHE